MPCGRLSRPPAINFEAKSSAVACLDWLQNTMQDLVTVHSNFRNFPPEGFAHRMNIPMNNYLHSLTG